jgi:hypothetical protein
LILFFSFDFNLDEGMTDNEEMNADMIDALKKDLETMLPNFEEHLRKKYPMFVIILIRYQIEIDFL